MNFSYKWVNWVMQCVTNVQFSFLINGSPSKLFNPSRGLRQGDPISPYLFLFCANILSLALTKEENQKRNKVGRNGISFTHLFFVDDSFFFPKMIMLPSTILEKLSFGIAQFLVKALTLNKSNLFCSLNIP